MGDARTYSGLRVLREGGGIPTDRSVEELKRQTRRLVVEMRREVWVSRGRGQLSYRVTQVLTGHGCFGEYLRRIGKEATAQCHHCDGDQDTAQHTLQYCRAWREQRRVLVRYIGRDLSLPTVIRQILGSERSWRAFFAFCEEVLSQKEEAERRRERTDPFRFGRARPRRRPARGDAVPPD